jgi:hypothetical protein
VGLTHFVISINNCAVTIDQENGLVDNWLIVSPEENIRQPLMLVLMFICVDIENSEYPLIRYGKQGPFQGGAVANHGTTFLGPADSAQRTRNPISILDLSFPCFPGSLLWLHFHYH